MGILILFISLFIITGLNSNLTGKEPREKTFVVSVNGSDSNPGTHTQPMATVEAARDAARLAGPENSRILILPGNYYLNHPIELDSRDNGLLIEAEITGEAVLYGGTPVRGWKSEGDHLWYVDLPEVKKGLWDFRALVVNGKLPSRARVPESGTLTHLQDWNVKVLPAIAGYWERQPTVDDLTVMAYNPEDIPESFDINNAELRIYHMWKESLVGVKYNDIEKSRLIFSSPAVEPPGAYGIKKYVIFNTREGMTKPGRWYLDRSNGRLVYWPLDGEDMASADVIAPRMENIIRIAGSRQDKVKNITLRGLALQATTIPLKSAGFGGRDFDGALSLSNIEDCLFENLIISNTGGMGISASGLANVNITGCHVFNTGAACLNIGGTDLLFAHNHIHDAGLYFPGSAAMGANGTRIKIYRNEIHDAPYSGMIIGRSDIVAEENLIYRVMTEVHDGAAIYASRGTNITMRGNIVRDIEPAGSGYGASGFYIDEGASNCLIEKNVTIGVSRPVLSHISRNSAYRDNFFMNDGDLTLHFQSSAYLTFEGNTIVTPGEVIIKSPNAITKWEGNKIIRGVKNELNDTGTWQMDFQMPFVPPLEKKNWNITAESRGKVPVIDGNMEPEEWPGSYFRLDRDPSRYGNTGAPVMMKYSWDNNYLYIGGVITMFDNDNISFGNIWGKNDGVEITIAGMENGNPVTFIIRSYVDGSIHCFKAGSLFEQVTEKIGEKVKFVPKLKESKGWVGEWAIPLKTFGLAPLKGDKIPFNMCAYVNEYHNWHCWEGTLGESLESENTGVLEFK